MVHQSLHVALQRQGIRLTRARAAVLQVLEGTAEHLKVAEVHQRAMQIAPRIGLASVYRTMDLLARLRLVKHVHLDHRHRHYAPVTDGHCHHLVCNTCGCVVEFSDCRADGLTRILSRRTRFRIDGHCMDFFGQCPKCQAQSRPAHGPAAARIPKAPRR